MSSSTAKTPCTAQRSTSAASITRRLPSRSATTPPNSITSTIGRIRAAITQPSSVPPPPPPSTAKATATGAIEEPTSEVA